MSELLLSPTGFNIKDSIVSTSIHYDTSSTPQLIGTWGGRIYMKL